MSSFENVHFYEVKLKVDVDKLGGRGGQGGEELHGSELLPPGVQENSMTPARDPK